MSYTKQVLHQTKKIHKQKFIMALVKHHSSSDMPTIKKNKLIQNYQTNIGMSYQQTKLQAYSWKFWEPTNHTTKALRDVSYVSTKASNRSTGRK